jgi:predicted DNA-binding protein YlxM (UPF0122 family)
MKLITRKQEQLTLTFYRKGDSGLKIAKKLNLSISQIYDALKRTGFPRRDAKERLRISPLTFSFPDHITNAQKQLLIAGVMLYFGEGAKTGSTVDLANSDPKIIKIFLKFLRKIFCVDEKKLRFYLYCFSSQNPENLKKYWGEELNVSLDKFTKPYVREVRASKMSRISPYGVLHVRYNDKRLLEKILSLCSDLAAQIINN